MWNQYPPPSYAAYAWFQGDKLCLALPGETSGHKVTVQIDMKLLRSMAQTIPFAEQRFTLEERKTLGALYAALATLQARETNEPRTIGHPSAPTQHDLDEIQKALRAGKITRAEPKRKASETLTLEDLDI